MLAYREPGVHVSEAATPQISPLIAAPADICLVGPALGYQVRTDQFVLTGTGAIPLPGLPAGAVLADTDPETAGTQSSVTVKDAVDPTKGAANGSGYTITTDYTVSTVNGTISRVGGGGIADNTLVNVTYAYLPPDYFLPYRLFDLGAVESRYGTSLNASGTAINSPLTYAAQIAFENGAPSVVCQPLFARATPGDTTTSPIQPSAASTALTSTWQDTLFSLRDIDDINILVPIIGQSVSGVADARQLEIIQAFQDHIQVMKTQNDQYILGLFAEDSSTDAAKATKTILRTHAATLAGRYGGSVAEQSVLVSPSRFRRALPNFGSTILIGGQYVAAALAGMLASRPVSSALTRKLLSGIVEVSDPRTRQDKDNDAASGLLVVEQRRGIIQVRHSITLNTNSAATREVSVVRAKHRMIESVRDTLDRQIIGNLIADQNAPLVVANAVEAVLSDLLSSRDIVDHSPVSARLLTLEPTTIQVKFSYRPAFPVNYIDVEFSLDLTAQTVTTNVV